MTNDIKHEDAVVARRKELYALEDERCKRLHAQEEARLSERLTDLIQMMENDGHLDRAPITQEEKLVHAVHRFSYMRCTPDVALQSAIRVVYGSRDETTAGPLETLIERLERIATGFDCIATSVQLLKSNYRPGLKLIPKEIEKTKEPTDLALIEQLIETGRQSGLSRSDVMAWFLERYNLTALGFVNEVRNEQIEQAIKFLSCQKIGIAQINGNVYVVRYSTRGKKQVWSRQVCIQRVSKLLEECEGDINSPVVKRFWEESNKLLCKNEEVNAFEREWGLQCYRQLLAAWNELTTSTSDEIEPTVYPQDSGDHTNECSPSRAIDFTPKYDQVV